MPRGEQLSRQWSIVKAIENHKYGVSIRYLADENGCSRRTIYRDLNALTLAGFPLYTDKVEGETRWLLMEGYKLSETLPFTMTELLSLYFSRDLLKTLKGTIFFDSFNSLITKIKTILPPPGLAYIDQIEDTFRVSFKS